MKTIKDAQVIAETLLGQQYREVDFVADSFDTSGNEPLLVRGDLSGGAEVRGVSAVVVNGEVRGTVDHPCAIFTEGPVVILGNVRHAQIQGQGIYLNRGVSASQLIADDEIHVKEDLVNVKVHIGNAESLGKEVEVLRDIIRSGRTEKADLHQQIAFKRRQLVKLFEATGITFNLNIGQIVRHTKRGLMINLASFYNALDGRSEQEVDQALREFFAKAIVGVLTRLNRDYIAKSPSNHKGFGGVVQKLQDLVFQTREMDKVIERVQKREERFWSNLSRFNKNDGVLCVQGAVLPDLELCFSRLDRKDDEQTSDEVVLRKFEMALKTGNRKGRHEAVLRYNDHVVDMIFIPPQAVHQVSFFAPDDRIMWASNAVEKSE